LSRLSEPVIVNRCDGADNPRFVNENSIPGLDHRGV